MVGMVWGARHRIQSLAKDSTDYEESGEGPACGFDALARGATNLPQTHEPRTNVPPTIYCKTY